MNMRSPFVRRVLCVLSLSLPVLAGPVIVGCGASGDDLPDGHDAAPSPSPAPSPADDTTPPSSPTPSDAGSPTPDVDPNDADGDGAPRALDCDDTDATVYPGASEICDGIDNDCDHAVDEGLVYAWYRDADGDGYGDSAEAITDTCVQPEGYVASRGDCDDSDPAVNASADEVCDFIDNDCDGKIDEGFTTTWYLDADGDGYGTPTVVLSDLCAQPDGYVPNASDCDDEAPDIHPGLDEICDTLDNDCDGQVDEDLVWTWYRDADGDGFGNEADVLTGICDPPSGYASRAGDCDDSDPVVHDGATELCDGKDNDCDTFVDEGLLSTWYLDNDRDGFGGTTSLTWTCAPIGYVLARGDCDDQDPTAHPGAEDPVGDGRDLDCGGTDAAEPHVGLNDRSQAAVQDALDLADDGMTVWVGSGTWRGVRLTWRGKAIVLAATDPARDTLLTNGQLGTVVDFSRHEGPGAVLDGFTISGGYAPMGGGIYVERSSPTVRGCTLVDNRSGDANELENVGGGGLYVVDGSIVVEDTLFSANIAQSNFWVYDVGLEAGGAVYLLRSSATFSTCTFIDNRVAQYSYNVGSNSSFSDDTWEKGGPGGAAYLEQSDASFIACGFDTNQADDGGAIFAYDSTLQMRQSWFTGNVALGWTSDGYYEYYDQNNPYNGGWTTWHRVYGGVGGALLGQSSEIDLEHGSIAGGAAFYGAGLAIQYGSSLRIEQASVTGGTAGTYEEKECSDEFNDGIPEACTYSTGGGQGGGLYLDGSSVITNAILAYNTPDNLYSLDGLETVIFSDLYNASGAPNHNLESLDPTVRLEEPGFLSYADADGQPCLPDSAATCVPSDLHLALSSPLIDAGDPEAVDPDATRSDPGIYGGPDGDAWDRDGDGFYDWFWPGTLEDAPDGLDPMDWDCDDRNPAVRNCAM